MVLVHVEPLVLALLLAGRATRELVVLDGHERSPARHGLGQAAQKDVLAVHQLVDFGKKTREHLVGVFLEKEGKEFFICFYLLVFEKILPGK